MPGKDGKAVLDALKADKPHCPVVIFSVYHDDATDLSKEIRKKADGIIARPIDNKSVRKKIKEVLLKIGEEGR